MHGSKLLAPVQVPPAQVKVSQMTATSPCVTSLGTGAIDSVTVDDERTVTTLGTGAIDSVTVDERTVLSARTLAAAAQSIAATVSATQDVSFVDREGDDDEAFRHS